MPEKYTPVQMVKIDYICDTCETGKMLPSGPLTNMDGDYVREHTCSHCGAKHFFDKAYPTTGYIELES